MAKESSKMQSWQIFHYARKYLGRSSLYVMFGKKNSRSIDYWCENPTYTSKPDNAYDPISGVKALLTNLDDQGHTAVVRSALHYLVSETTLQEDELCEYAELLPTMTDEILADFRVVASLQRSIENKLDPDKVAAIKNMAVAEIERTYARYLKDTVEENE